MVTNKEAHGMKAAYFYRFIWFGCFSVCLPIMLAGLVYYQFSMKGGIANIQSANQTSLIMVEQFTEKVMRDIVDRSFQLAFDPAIGESFNLQQYQTNYVAQMELLNKISLEKYQNSLIGDIYYYYRQANLVLSTEAGHQKTPDFNFNKDIAQLEITGQDGQWIYLPEGLRHGYISFALRLPTLSSDETDSQGLLVTQVDVSQIKKYFANVSLLAKSQSIIALDEQQRPLFHMQKENDPQTYLNEEVLHTIIAAPQQSGGFQAHGSLGESFFYSYKKSTSGHMYISVTPYQAILGELAWIRWITLAAVLALISICMVLTIISLRRAYNPIRQLFDHLNKQTQTLGEQLDRLIPPLMERLLQQWLAGNYIHSPTMYDECRKYGIPVDHTFVVLLFKVENLFKGERFRPEDKPVITFAVTNVMRELLSSHPKLRGYVLHDSQGQGTAILYFDREDPLPSMVHQTKLFAESVQAAIQQYLKLQVSVGIGRFYPHIADIRVSYRESKLALQYRLYNEQESVLYIDDLESTQKLPTFRYPRAIQNSIVDALAIGDKKQAQLAMEAFTHALQPSESYAISSQCYPMLLAAIIASVEHKGGGIPDMLEYDLFDQLRARETRAEMCEWFSDHLFPLYEQISDENYHKSGKLIAQKVRKHVLDHISREISLAECADLLHISPAYLSRLFKKEIGGSFLDFVTESKMNEARRLLTATDANISHIAEAVGYSHRTFNRVFQRLLKMSPSDYRTHYR
ncbi:helix-turn-helix domain-containing protein [Paenibacillus agricola]|uniref:Helix-turn-helix transcriptional regulator n=1 Tax=Paenibacillus agricola TaxID=2716264 RepID=A0ABX0IZM5_9BACL|nr:helix-turn-helix domain-containing protein [Paenibacillus agricola]NHN29016.1 helix-turn-helix transcriptional regulator [Paenibacillus agricola]